MDGSRSQIQVRASLWDALRFSGQRVSWFPTLGSSWRRERYMRATRLHSRLRSILSTPQQPPRNAVDHDPDRSGARRHDLNPAVYSFQDSLQLTVLMTLNGRASDSLFVFQFEAR